MLTWFSRLKSQKEYFLIHFILYERTILSTLSIVPLFRTRAAINLILNSCIVNVLNPQMQALNILEAKCDADINLITSTLFKGLNKFVRDVLVLECLLNVKRWFVSGPNRKLFGKGVSMGIELDCCLDYYHVMVKVYFFFVLIHNHINCLVGIEYKFYR